MFYNNKMSFCLNYHQNSIQQILLLPKHLGENGKPFQKNHDFYILTLNKNFNKMKKKLLKAMYLAQKGDWNAAHEIVKDMDNEYAWWVHAHLHRKEADLNNAAYWYLRSQKTMPKYSLAQEWQEIFDFLSETETSLQ
jgi:hypothetical protein